MGTLTIGRPILSEKEGKTREMGRCLDGVFERGVVADAVVAEGRTNIMGNQEKELRRSKAPGMKTQMENLNASTECEGLLEGNSYDCGLVACRL